MDTGDPSFHRSGAVAHMLRMPVATLRVWARRYGLTQPALSPSGQRLYGWVGRGVTRSQRQRHGQLRHEGEVPGAGHRTGLGSGQVGDDMAAVVVAVEHRIQLGHDDKHGHTDSSQALGREYHRHRGQRDHGANATVGHRYQPGRRRDGAGGGCGRVMVCLQKALGWRYARTVVMPLAARHWRANKRIEVSPSGGLATWNQHDPLRWRPL